MTNTNINLFELISTILRNKDCKIELTSPASIYKLGTCVISKEFKNASNYEIENWAINIEKELEKIEYIDKNCSADFRIYNDGNEKWNTGLLFIWV